MLALLGDLAPACAEHGARLGLAPHSLRAVPPESLSRAVAGLHAMDATAPVHIHIAEQQKEVDDCLAWCGVRPVEWLLDHAPVDARWCLIHATHMDWDERRRLAHSGAVAGICPTTEANLGDGVFDAAPYLAQQGAWGIGSDSHASVSVAEELRTFEYGQRLEPATAQRPGFGAACPGGGPALARSRGRRRPGGRAPGGRAGGGPAGRFPCAGRQPCHAGWAGRPARAGDPRLRQSRA